MQNNNDDQNKTIDPTSNTTSNDQSVNPNTPPVLSFEETTPPMMNPGNNDLTKTEEAVEKKQEEAQPEVKMDIEPKVENSDSGSAAPTSDVAMPPIIAPTMQPKKKFAGGRVIATILGLFLLVGGVGAGLVLTRQDQNPNEKAAGTGECTKDTDCGDPNDGWECLRGFCVHNPPGSKCENNNDCAGGEECRSGKCVPCVGECGDSPTPPPVVTTNCTQVSCYTTLDHTYGGECKNDQFCYHEVKDKICSKPADKTCNQCGWNGASSAEDTVSPAGPKCIVEFIDTVLCEPRNCSDNPTTPPATKPPEAAQCTSVKGYLQNWTLISDFATVRPGTSIYFCVSGTSTSGSFDKAQFTINGVTTPETTNKRPGSNDFCYLYTLQTGSASYNVTASIHHVTLGWVGGK